MYVFTFCQNHFLTRSGRRTRESEERSERCRSGEGWSRVFILIIIVSLSIPLIRRKSFDIRSIIPRKCCRIRDILAHNMSIDITSKKTLKTGSVLDIERQRIPILFCCYGCLQRSLVGCDGWKRIHVRRRETSDRIRWVDTTRDVSGVVLDTVRDEISSRSWWARDAACRQISEILCHRGTRLSISIVITVICSCEETFFIKFVERWIRIIRSFWENSVEQSGCCIIFLKSGSQARKWSQWSWFPESWPALSWVDNRKTHLIGRWGWDRDFWWHTVDANICHSERGRIPCCITNCDTSWNSGIIGKCARVGHNIGSFSDIWTLYTRRPVLLWAYFEKCGSTCTVSPIALTRLVMTGDNG